MMSATAALATPSTVSCPTELELITGKVVLEVNAQPGETTYQSGSPSASTSFSVPIVRQGKRPTLGKVQLDAVFPSVLELSKEPGASGQGRAPGLSSPAFAACAAT